MNVATKFVARVEFYFSTIHLKRTIVFSRKKAKNYFLLFIMKFDIQ